MTHLWHDLKSTHHDPVGVVEIPQGSRLKYELDKETGTLKLDRVLMLDCPSNYGFIPRTLSDDMDPLDVFILSAHSLVPLAAVSLRIIGVINVLDNGVRDEKILAVIQGEDSVDCYMEDVTIGEIECYLKNYKHGIELLGTAGYVEAMKVIDAAYAAYDAANIKALIRPYSTGVYDDCL